MMWYDVLPSWAEGLIGILLLVGLAFALERLQTWWVSGCPVLRRHHVRFYSPGTMFAEQSSRMIKSWDVERAMELARGVRERYNATPYGFRFETSAVSLRDLRRGAKTVAKSAGTYYLGGVVETLEEIQAQAAADPEFADRHRTLIANMECNDWDRMVRIENSWSWCQPFKDGDVLLEYET